MADICISSDITNDHLLVELSDLLEITGLNLHSIREGPFYLSLNNTRLFDVLKEVTANIETILASRVPFVNKPIQIINSDGKTIEFRKTTTNVSYRGNIIEIDFKERTDFHLCMLISLYDLLEKSIRFNGALFIFDRSRVEEYDGSRIISLLRVRFALTEEALINELKKVVQYENFIEIEPNLKKNLAALEKLGLLHFDNNLKEYTLTGRGYICW